MRTYLVAGLVMLLLACNKKATTFNETRQQDFYLMSGKVFYSKQFHGLVNLLNAEKELTKNNFPNGGHSGKIGLKLKIEWSAARLPIRVARLPGERITPKWRNEKPLNATFEIIKTDNGYEVVVQNMWFNNDLRYTRQENIVIEKYIVDEKDLGLSDQNTLNIIKHLCQKLETYCFTWNQVCLVKILIQKTLLWQRNLWGNPEFKLNCNWTIFEFIDLYLCTIKVSCVIWRPAFKCLWYTSHQSRNIGGYSGWVSIQLDKQGWLLCL